MGVTAAPRTRWEHGSFLPAASDDVFDEGGLSPGWTLFGNGRSALCAAVKAGSSRRGWRRLWVPGYFCQEALKAVASLPIELATYEHLPGHPPRLPRVASRDVLLLNNLLGLAVHEPEHPRCDVIEDHTHDPYGPWAVASRATFCIASLRKTVPVPDGAALWSPIGDEVPRPPPNPACDWLAESVYQAMIAKRRYLAGESINKDEYRTRHLVGTEALESLGAGAASLLTESLLPALPVRGERAARARNHAILAMALRERGVDTVLAAPGAAPIGCTVVVDPARRDSVVARLNELDVYPAILWSLEDPIRPVTAREREVSRSVFTLHIDGRYDEMHLVEVAVRIGSALS